MARKAASHLLCSTQIQEKEVSSRRAQVMHEVLVIVPPTTVLRQEKGDMGQGSAVHTGAVQATRRPLKLQLPSL